VATYSVIVPTFNRLRWLPECLDNLPGEDPAGVEVIVVDDCSTDGTQAFLAEAAATRGNLTPVLLPRNVGASAARNIGVAVARGEYCVFIDSDDVLETGYFDELARLFTAIDRLGLVCCESMIIDADGGVISEGWNATNATLRGVPPPSGNLSFSDLFYTSTSFPGFALPREVLRQVAGFDPFRFPLDDYDLALRVALAGYNVHFVPQVFARYRVHGSNESGRGRAAVVTMKTKETLRAAAMNAPEGALEEHRVRRRLAEVEFDSGVAQLWSGRRVRAAVDIGTAIRHDPGLARRAVRQAANRVRRLRKRK
jgi:GT2 family glycosyltransferase